MLTSISRTVFNSSVKLARAPYDLARGVLGGPASPAEKLADGERERATHLREQAEVRERAAAEHQAKVDEAAGKAAAEARRKAEQEKRKADKRRRDREARAKKAEQAKKQKATKAAAKVRPPLPSGKPSVWRRRRQPPKQHGRTENNYPSPFSSAAL